MRYFLQIVFGRAQQFSSCDDDGPYIFAFDAIHQYSFHATKITKKILQNKDWGKFADRMVSEGSWKEITP